MFLGSICFRFTRHFNYFVRPEPLYYSCYVLLRGTCSFISRSICSSAKGDESRARSIKSTNIGSPTGNRKVDSRPGNCDVIVLMETGMGGGGTSNDDVTSRGSSGWRHRRRSVHPVRARALHLECICAMTSLRHHFLLAAADVYLVLSRQFVIQKYHVAKWNCCFLFRIFLLAKYYAKKRDQWILFYFVPLFPTSWNSMLLPLSRSCQDWKIFITRAYTYGVIRGLKHFFTILRNEILICNKFRFLYIGMIDLQVNLKRIIRFVHFYDCYSLLYVLYLILQPSF